MTLRNPLVRTVYIGQVIPKGVDFFKQGVAALTHPGTSIFAVSLMISEPSWFCHVRNGFHHEQAPYRPIS
jgi:hypothetical protein